jgi:hypothetical protein
MSGPYRVVHSEPWGRIWNVVGPTPDSFGYLTEGSATDAARRANAAYAAGQAGGGEWQDIETAPKDGSYVLIACDEVYVARYDAENELWYFPVDGCAVDPTHWKPRPKPPLLPPQTSTRGKMLEDKEDSV